MGCMTRGHLSTSGSRRGWGLHALLLCTSILAGCGGTPPSLSPEMPVSDMGVADDKTHVTIHITGQTADRPQFSIAATLQGGPSYTFDTADLSSQAMGQLVLEFKQEVRGTLTITATASGTGCNLATGSATLMLTGQAQADVTVSLAPAVVPRTVVVNAVAARMALGYEQKLVAMATYSDGSSKDVSALATWSSADSTVAVVDSTGLLAGLRRGTTMVSAALSCPDSTTQVGGSTQVSVVGTGQFHQPEGVLMDGSGNIYVADTYGHTLRVISSLGVVSTVAGMAEKSGEVDGQGDAARFFFPVGLALDAGGNILVADFGGDTIRQVTPAGGVTTIAGTGLTPGTQDGNGAAARFNGPNLIALAPSGDLYVADESNSAIRRLTSGRDTSVYAGTAGTAGFMDGPGAMAQFRNPDGVAVDSKGNVFVADGSNNAIRKIAVDQVVSSLVPPNGTLASPFGIAVDADGNLYVASFVGHQIFKVKPDGTYSVFAGTGGPGTQDGAGATAQFHNPCGVTLDKSGNLLVADGYNHTIRRITPDGVVSTVAGTPGQPGSADSN